MGFFGLCLLSPSLETKPATSPTHTFHICSDKIPPGSHPPSPLLWRETHHMFCFRVHRRSSLRPSVPGGSNKGLLQRPRGLGRSRRLRSRLFHTYFCTSGDLGRPEQPARLPFVGRTDLMSRPARRCWYKTKKQRNASQGCLGKDLPPPEFEALTFDTHSEVHLLVSGCLRCCQRKTGSYGWSLGESASRGPEKSQQSSFQITSAANHDAILLHNSCCYPFQLIPV